MRFGPPILEEIDITLPTFEEIWTVTFPQPKSDPKKDHSLAELPGFFCFTLWQ